MTVVFHRLSVLIICLLSFYARAGTERYIIYPKSLPPQERFQLPEKINELAGAQGKVYISTWRAHIRFWLADLTETAYKELSEDARVADIHVNKVAIDLFTENKSSDRNRTQMFRQNSEMTSSNLSASEENLVYVTEKSPVASELRVLSQPVAGGSISHYPNYVYPIGGRSTYIYHVELGINEQHDDFRDRTIEWLYTGLSKATGANIRTEAAAGRGHSTCTASKAVGNLYGASRSATLVVVKMPNLDEASVLEVLDTVMDDIHDKHRKATSVVSISWGTKKILDGGPPYTPLEMRLIIQIRNLNKIGVPIICAAGNAASEFHGTKPRMYVDTVPAALSTLVYSGTFFVVGNSDINGLRYPTSQMFPPAWSPTQVYAPGVNIKCASSTS